MKKVSIQKLVDMWGEKVRRFTMKKIIVCGTILCLLGLVGAIRANYAHIGLDAIFSDWVDVNMVSDPLDDDLPPKMQDIVEVAMANDEVNLYFYVRVDGTDGDQFGGDGGPPARHEELHFYIDGDNDIGTGGVVGPEGGKIGAEFRFRTTRRVDPTDLKASSQSELEYWFPGFGGWWPTGWNTKRMGIANPVTVLTGVNEIEIRVAYKGDFDRFQYYSSYYSYFPLDVNDTITYTVLALRGSEGDPNSIESDWLDTPQTYTIVSGCGDPNHPFPQGDFNKDCRVNFEDLKILTEDWLTCTDPNDIRCMDLGWY